jgi:hypothetical protein
MDKKLQKKIETMMRKAEEIQTLCLERKKKDGDPYDSLEGQMNDVWWACENALTIVQQSKK